MQENQNYLFKGWLSSVNQYFRKRQAELSYEITPQNHKLNAKLGIAKNFMRLTNKALLGMNKIHFSRTAIFSGLLGLLCGWLYSQADTNIQFLIDNHRQVTKTALIKQVLRNSAIKNKLNQALLNNVYTNPDVQYKLHELLIRKAILPQTSNLFQLSNTEIIKALESDQFIKSASKLAAEAITENGDKIAKLALQFLGSDKMINLINKNVSELLQREETNQQVAEQLRQLILSQMKLTENKESLYKWIRQNFINW